MGTKAVLFDMDGVIVRSEPLHAAAFKKTLERHDLDLTDEVYIRYFAGRTDRKGFEAYFKYVGMDASIEECLHEKTTVFLEMVNAVEPYPGIIGLIKKLTTHGIKRALVTR